MGIPRLKSHLQPFSRTINFKGRAVVIDGPAFAYHVLHLCLRKANRATPFEQPSYDLLGKTAVAWLDQLSSCGATVSAIYFDGYLPIYKIEERKRRLIKTSKGLRSYFSSNPIGVASSKGDSAVEDEVSLFSPISFSGYHNGLPIPPFTVPAILEALSNSKSYGRLTKVVPGEADTFCASHVRIQGGVILTSDSDLLVYNLGGDGIVGFLSDIKLEENNGLCIITISAFRPQEICARLDISDGLSMSALAFELAKDPCATLSQVLKRTRSHITSAFDRSAYGAFMEPYKDQQLLRATEIVNSTSNIPLDPRVSELVLQADNTSFARPGLHADAIGRPCIYLPTLLDSPSRSSAWETSSSVRQLGYGLLNLLGNNSISSFIEFRRLQSPSNGTNVIATELSSLDRTAMDLSESLSKLRDVNMPSELQWLMYSVYLDVIDSASKSRSHVLSLQMIHDTRDVMDSASWDFVHFFAQVQGTFYSFRILQQVIDYVSRKHAMDLPAAFSDLRLQLSHVPALAGFPTIASFATQIQAVRSSGSLANAMEALDFPDGIAGQLRTMLMSRNGREESKGNETNEQLQPRGGGSRSNNPYEALHMDF